MSIYGKAKDEWDKLAKWAIGHDVCLCVIIKRRTSFLEGLVQKFPLDDPNPTPL
jgi:hypothetical protein